MKIVHSRLHVIFHFYAMYLSSDKKKKCIKLILYWNTYIQVSVCVCMVYTMYLKTDFSHCMCEITQVKLSHATKCLSLISQITSRTNIRIFISKVSLTQILVRILRFSIVAYEDWPQMNKLSKGEENCCAICLTTVLDIQ